MAAVDLQAASCGEACLAVHGADTMRLRLPGADPRPLREGSADSADLAPAVSAVAAALAAVQAEAVLVVWAVAAALAAALAGDK